MTKILGVHTESLETIKSYGIGFAQTWQNPTRAFNTQYTNSTGRPIMVEIYATGTGDTALTATISGVSFTIGRNSVTGGGPVGSFIVPVGATYSVAYTGQTLQSWFELR